MRPGEYYIGDPSYITKGNPGYHWIEKLWDAFYADKTPAKKLIIDNVSLFIGQTAGGDGVFDGFFVDTGVIVVMKIDNLKDDRRFNFTKIKCGKYLSFAKDFVINYNKGVFNIGNQIIITTE